MENKNYFPQIIMNITLTGFCALSCDTWVLLPCCTDVDSELLEFKPLDVMCYGLSELELPHFKLLLPSSELKGIPLSVLTTVSLEWGDDRNITSILYTLCYTLHLVGFSLLFRR